MTRTGILALFALGQLFLVLTYTLGDYGLPMGADAVWIAMWLCIVGAVLFDENLR